MMKLILREFLLIAVFWSIFLGCFFIFKIPIILIWSIYCAILFSLFFLNTLILKYWIKNHLTLPGLVFAVFSFFNLLLFLLLLFFFLKPQDSNHRMMVIIAMVGYLICSFMDTRWKLRWIQDNSN